jgi:mono/diheme cytochrome c family protein
MDLIRLGMVALFAFHLGAQDKEKIEQGRYLVEEVGKCQECHTPRLENGELDRSKWLEGAVLNFTPIKPVEGWHKTSPGLTPDGRLWDRWKEEGIRNYLVTGLNPKGGKADAPMPTYKMKPADVDAIIAYLKTLKK